jgi:subtilisin family serine protease
MKELNYHIQSIKKQSKNIVNSLANPIIYKASDFGFFGKFTGKGVKIGIIDSGKPEHSDIRNIKESVDLSDELSEDVIDYNGHATMLAGILTSYDDKSIIGLCPDAELYSTKVMNKDNQCSYNAIVSSILWHIINKVDILLIALGSVTEYAVLHDVIKKAYQQNICILAAVGNHEEEYPASYPEVLSIGKVSKISKDLSANINVLCPENCYTTYLHDRYAKISGTSLATVIATGIAALMIEKLREENKTKPTVNTVYQELSALFRAKK